MKMQFFTLLGQKNGRKRFILKSKIAVLAIIVINGVASADLKTGLVAYWSFDDCTAKDASGSRRDGVLHSGSNSGIECVTGVKGKALHFNRIDGDNGFGRPGGDYVIVPTLPATFFEGFSGCAWAEFEENRHWERIFDFGNGATQDNVLLARQGISNYLVSHSYNDAHFAYQVQSTSFSAIANKAIKHYCVTIRRSDGMMALYINGDLVGQQTGGAIRNVTRASNFLAHSNWPRNDPDFK